MCVLGDSENYALASESHRPLNSTCIIPGDERGLCQPCCQCGCIGAQSCKKEENEHTSHVSKEGSFYTHNAAEGYIAQPTAYVTFFVLTVVMPPSCAPIDCNNIAQTKVAILCLCCETSKHRHCKFVRLPKFYDWVAILSHTN